MDENVINNESVTLDKNVHIAQHKFRPYSHQVKAKANANVYISPVHFTLSALTRIVIRRNCFGPNLLWCFNTLNYPQKLREYILMADEPITHKKAFRRKPTARFGIEIQTLTIRFSKTIKMTLTLK